MTIKSLTEERIAPVTTHYEKVDRVRFSHRGGHALWTPKELLLLRNLYPVASWPKLRAALPARTKQAIQLKAVTLSIGREINRRTRWTGAEKAALKQMYPAATWPDICAALPRHPQGSIAKMANQMKLIRHKQVPASPYPIIRELRAERQRQGIPTWELADKIGIHHVHLAKWERGEFVPRLRGFFDWIEALGCDLTLAPAQQQIGR